MEGDYDKTTGEMVVNTEWGSFDNEMVVLPDTPYDKQLDADSVNPGIQMFEKRVSGMFLGEILRIVIVSMLKHPKVALFRDDNSSHNDIRSTTTIAENSPLFKQWAVDSSILSIAEADHSVGYRVLRQEMDRCLGVSAASSEDAEAVKLIAHAIGKRAARLAGVAVAAIVIQSGRLERSTGSTAAPTAEVSEDDIVDIGVDGSLVEFYPNFEEYMRSAIRASFDIAKSSSAALGLTSETSIVADDELKVRIGIAKDGSGVGAALIALVAAGQEKDDYLGDMSRLRSRFAARGIVEEGLEDED